METCYVAKFNVEPDVLELYGEIDLIKNVIPNNLSKIYSNEVKDNDIVKFIKNTDFSKIQEDNDYLKMLQLRLDLIEQYEQVSANFKQTGEISYNKKYMGIRSELKEVIEQFYSKYPFLKNADELRIQSFSSGKTPEIQMGVVYIDRVEKIQKYLQIKIELKNNLEFYYDKTNERIYLPERYLDQRNIQNSFIKLLEEIENYINTFENTLDIGKVTINPIYEEIEIRDGKYKEITVIKVFPNGNPSKDRMKAINAAREEIKYKAPKEEILKHTELEKEYNNDGKNGYISAIISRGKNILENKILKREI